MINFKRKSIILMMLVLISSIFLYTQYKANSKSLNKMQILSDEFSNNKKIPQKYTCDGDNFSPPLSIKGVVPKTKSLALIVEDIDSPVKDFTHWIIFNIPPNTTDLKSYTPTIVKLQDDSIQGMNDFGQIGYGGPCPPSGTHQYVFKLYALNCMLDLKAGVTNTQIKQAMKSHILATSQLTGTYNRNN